MSHLATFHDSYEIMLPVVVCSRTYLLSKQHLTPSLPHYNSFGSAGKTGVMWERAESPRGGGVRPLGRRDVTGRAIFSGQYGRPMMIMLSKHLRLTPPHAWWGEVRDKRNKWEDRWSQGRGVITAGPGGSERALHLCTSTVRVSGARGTECYFVLLYLSPSLVDV